MSNLAPEQRSAIRDRALELGFDRDIAFRISMNAIDSNACTEKTKGMFLSGYFVWLDSPEGHEFWSEIYFNLNHKE